MSEKKVLQIVTGRKIEFDDKKVTTCTFRLSYPHLFKAKAYKNNAPKFSLSMLFNKSDDISQIKIAAHNAAVEKWGADKKQWPSKKVRSSKTGLIVSKTLVVMPFYDGDIEQPDKPEYEGTIYLNASCNKPPVIVDQGRQQIVDETKLKAGDYVRASIVAFAYDIEGAFGVSFALLGVQKVRTGEALGGGNALKDFDELEVDEDDEIEVDGDATESDLF